MARTFDDQSNLVKRKDFVIRLTGNGAAQPTQSFGAGMTVNRTGVGVIEILWQQVPGQYVGLTGRCFEATTQSQLKGFTVVAGDFDTTNLKITLNITNAAEVLADLAAAQSLTLNFTFVATRQ